MQNILFNNQNLHIAGTFTISPVASNSGIKSNSRKGDFCTSERAKKWVKILETDKTPQLIRKARSLARKGCIRGLSADENAVNAFGISEKGHKLFIKFPILKIDESKKENLVKLISSNTIDSMMIFKNKLPKNKDILVKLIDQNILPLENGFNGTCTCEDWSLPCRHTMAAAYLLCEAFDYNPILPLEILGITRQRIYKSFCKKRGIIFDSEETVLKTIEEVGQKNTQASTPFKPSSAMFYTGLPKQARETTTKLDNQIALLLSQKPSTAFQEKACLPLWEGCAETGNWMEKLYKSVSKDTLKALSAKA